VRTAEEVRLMVEATRYPPHGRRGISVSQRANRFSRTRDYLARADEQIWLLIQIETEEAMSEVDSITRIDGLDGLFVDPSDLAASLGHLGDPGHAAVQKAFDKVLDASKRNSMPAGILAFGRGRCRTLYWERLFRRRSRQRSRPARQRMRCFTQAIFREPGAGPV
jgi:4-hydroxy-2-oxoheptanedioate aldolase